MLRSVPKHRTLAPCLAFELAFSRESRWTTWSKYMCYDIFRKVAWSSVAYLSDSSSEQMLTTSCTRLCTSSFRYSRTRCVFTVCLEIPSSLAIPSSQQSSNTSFTIANSRSDRLSTCVTNDQSSAESAECPGGGELSDAVNPCWLSFVRITHTDCSCCQGTGGVQSFRNEPRYC